MSNQVEEVSTHMNIGLAGLGLFVADGTADFLQAHVRQMLVVVHEAAEREIVGYRLTMTAVLADE